MQENIFVIQIYRAGAKGTKVAASGGSPRDKSNIPRQRGFHELLGLASMSIAGTKKIPPAEVAVATDS